MIDLLILAPCRERHRRKLEELFAESYRIHYLDMESSDAEGTAEALARAEVVIGEPELAQVTAECIKKLKWIQMTWAGTDIYTRHPGFPEQVILTNVSGAFGAIISEYVIGAILTQYRNFPEYWRNQEDAIWADAGRERTLDGKTVLTLGTGDIGSNIAKRMQAFGTKVLGICRSGKSSSPYFEQVYPLAALDDLLEQADIVIGCLPNTEETIGLLNRKRLLRMRKEALLVNVGRGSLIVTEDLIKVLQAGHLSGAVLDVVEPEPLSPESPLWKMNRVMITPHISGPGFSHEPGTEDRIWEICCENLSRYAKGEPLCNQVDFTSGYRRESERYEKR